MNHNLKIVQSEILNILEIFDEKCKENNLKYYIFYGTLLGAVRHKGFIPWDDDIDITMPREDYEKFISLYRDEFFRGYYLDGYNCSRYESYSPVFRINSKNVLLRRDKGNKEHWIGAFISIFPMDGLPIDVKERNKHIRKLMIIYALLRASRSSLFGLGNVKNRSIKEKIVIILNKIIKIGKFIPPARLAEKYNRLASQYNIENSKFVYICYDGQSSIFPRSLFDDTVDIEFEHNKYHAPAGYDELLTLYYGDYMTPPPLSEQSPAHSTDIKIMPQPLV